MKIEEARKHILDWIEFATNPDTRPFFDEPCTDEELLEAMQIGANALCQPHLPSNLDEAANKFAVSFDQGTCDGIAQDCFKAGAEWMAGQGYTFETTMQNDDVDELVPTCPDMYNHGYSCGDKIIVQIRKK